MKRIALPAVLSSLAGMPAVFAQGFVLPTTGAEFSGLFSQAIFAFILFYGLIMIMVGWVYKHTKDRPVEVVPVQPKTLAILGGISGIFVALTPTGLIPPELSSPFFMLVGAMLFIMFLGVAMDIAVFRGKEKESPEEAATYILGKSGVRATRQEAKLAGLEEKEELEEEDTLMKIVKFLHNRPHTRNILETLFTEHKKEFGDKVKQDATLVQLLGDMYRESKAALAEQKGVEELEAADILLQRGEAIIQAHEKDPKLRQQLKTELTYIKKSTRRIVEAVKAERDKLKMKKGEEEHILESIILLVDRTIKTYEANIKNLRATKNKQALEGQERILNELIDFDKLLRKLVQEIIAEEHYLAEEEAIAQKMRRIGKKVYGKAESAEEVKEAKEEKKILKGMPKEDY